MAGYFYRIKGTEFEDSPEYRDVVVLLDHGANPSQACGDTSPLFTTSQYANPAVMQLLVKRGASLSARDSHGLTPLHAVGEYQAFPRWSKDAGTVALDTCIARCVHVLVRAGAAVEARDPLGRTPLHVAAMHGDIPMAEALIADGADIHAKDVGGMTPKDLASSVEMLELLTKAGG